MQPGAVKDLTLIFNDNCTRECMFYLVDIHCVTLQTPRLYLQAYRNLVSRYNSIQFLELALPASVGGRNWSPPAAPLLQPRSPTSLGVSFLRVLPTTPSNN